MSLRSARLLQLLGLLISLFGLIGFWLNRDVGKIELTDTQRQVVGIEQGEFFASFVVAGRDYDYTKAASPCEWRGNVCYREETGNFVLGNRTDTILYVNIIGDKVTLVAIPRDIYLPKWQAKINEMYYYQEAEGLKSAVEDIINLPIDYYAVVNIDIFQDLVDALGGVDINIPYDMYYRDAAAGLVIDFDKGPKHLDGEDAAKFIRYRNTLRGDIDRIDNVKSLSYSMLRRLQELNIKAALKAPELINVVFKNIETNASPALVRSMLPRLANLQIQAATLPTEEVVIEGRSGEFTALSYDSSEIETFLAGTFEGQARVFVQSPDSVLLITNRSGEPDLEKRYKARLVAMGLAEEGILTREAAEDPTPSRIFTTALHWQNANYYTSLFGTGKQQIDRFPIVEGRAVDIELVLGRDAVNSGLGRSPSQDTIEIGFR